MGELLYHYTKAETALEYILKNKQLRFSPIHNTNDPYEQCNLVFSINTDHFCTENMNAKIMGEWMTKSFQVSHEIKNGVKALCFTKSKIICAKNDGLQAVALKWAECCNIGKGFARPRMWAQYAECFKGVCLEFDKTLLIQKMETDYSDFGLEFNDVTYPEEWEFADKVMQATSILEDKIATLSTKELQTELLEKYKQIYFYTKHPDWKDEKEFRFLIRDTGETDRFIGIDGGILKRVIIGTEMKDESIDKIKKLTEQFETKPEVARIEFWDGYYKVCNIV